jgi:membrane protease YdiL (CAAX protease family)
MLRETALAAPTSIVPNSTVVAIALAIGAGLSEELLFRMVGVAFVHWILSDICGVKTATTLIVAVIATAAAFTLYHSPSSLSSASIVFVAAASLYLGVLYVLRGFAVVVIAHAGYDAIVLLSLDVN